MSDTIYRLTRAMSVVLFIIAVATFLSSIAVAVHVNRVLKAEQLPDPTRVPWLIFGGGCFATLLFVAGALGLASLCIIYEQVRAPSVVDPEGRRKQGRPRAAGRDAVQEVVPRA